LFRVNVCHKPIVRVGQELIKIQKVWDFGEFSGRSENGASSWHEHGRFAKEIAIRPKRFAGVRIE
jgi:hypothetical protein